MSQATYPAVELIRRRMYTPTSTNDLRYMLGDNIPIILYEDLKNYQNIDDLLGMTQKAIILYPDSAEQQNSGHWTCVFRIPGSDIIEYFDSYGCFPDEPLGHEGTWAGSVRHSTKIPTYLLGLLMAAADNGSKIHWNETNYQSLDKPTQCCGLYCVFRLRNANMDENTFRRVYHDEPLARGISPDLLVSGLAVKCYPSLTITDAREK